MKNNTFSAGLVLEGGGLRAIYTSGVLDAFIENNIEFPYVIGVSAGTCNGVSFIGKCLHRMKNITINYSHDKRYMSVGSIFKNGEYLNSKWIFGELTYDLCPLDYDEYERSGATMCSVVTNAKTGEAEYLYSDSFRDGCEELRASCALPIATKPVEINGSYYFDGGVADSIPLKRAFDDGCEKCLVILTQDRAFQKQPVGHNAAMRLLLWRYPEIYKKVCTRHEMYNRQKEYIFEQEELGRAMVICPEEPLNCSTLGVTTERQQELYDLGYKQGLALVDKVREFIGS